MSKPRNGFNTVLIADDESGTREMVKNFLIRFGYKPILATNGNDAFNKAKIHQPHIILMDVNMPDMDGLSVCRMLREEASTRLIPILMVTGQGLVEEKVRGFDSGADDYLTKPFDTAELIARVETLLKRSQKMISANPLTHLPGSTMIQDEIESRIKSGKKFGTAYIDIDNFKAYNDAYGYRQGDEVIQWVSATIDRIIDTSYKKSREIHEFRPFLGHIGGDDFILVADSRAIKSLCEAIAAQFDQDRRKWYKWLHKLQGYIRVTDRQGLPHQFALMSLSIAVSTNSQRALIHYAQVAQIVSEVKKFAKGRVQDGSSCVVFDSRTK